ncbi:fibronectin type III domain-containing protein [Kineobactrum salinum]|uniref:Fibronectin type III domain-containing protein n=1 Tax=Kineobactrum salinum TaxID=2708301 RepID=A0A6C0TXZ1_9GAMM|nr:fibronectin type III domain-containing protein [Kineobactrum salinum]QIB64702.1 fibronectin type III domain-containing protein [Kineobactrum salinum]
MDELSWEGTAFSGDPGPQGRHGTFGRFAYVESIDSFVLVNNPNRNAYLFKLPTVPDNEPPTAPTGLAVTHPYPGALSVTWKAGEDNFGVAGYRVFVDGEQVAEQAGTEFKTMAYAPGTRLEVQVQAFDSAGFSSELSRPLTLGLPSQQPRMRLGDCSSEAMLRNRDDIVFCEPWEKHSWWQTGNWLRDPIVDDPRPMTSNSARYTQVTDKNCLSGNCLRVKMEEGKTWALSAYWPLANANLAPKSCSCATT